MSQHDENVEVELIKRIRAAEDAGDYESSKHLRTELGRLYEDDAEQFAKEFSSQKDDVSRGNLKGNLLAWLAHTGYSRRSGPIWRYDYEKYDSFYLYVMFGWKRFVIRQDRRQLRSQRSVVKAVDQSMVVSLDAQVSSDDDSPRHVEMMSAVGDGQDEADGRDLLGCLCRAFEVNDVSEQAALRDTINGDAGPAERRIGLSILSREIEHRPTISRFWASRFWADAATRRKLWQELAEPLPTRD